MVLGLVLGTAAGLALSAAGQPPLLCRTAGVAVLMATWWITEAINIYVTGLIPVALFPLLGILPMKELAPLYMKEVIFLFIGGFILAFAVERWGLHQRVALRIIASVGATPVRLMGGFMLAAWFLSMWILNTATVTLLLPAALAVCDQWDSRMGKGSVNLATPLLLGLAYAASIGGTTTLIGTMPNLVLKDFYSEHFPALPPLDFAHWFVFALPFSAAFVLAAWLWLRWIFLRRQDVRMDLSWLHDARLALGPVRYEEKVLGAGFALTVLAWFTMSDIQVGSILIPGWADSLHIGAYVRESTVAMAVALGLYMWPARHASPHSGGASREAPSKFHGGIVQWADVQRLPLGVIFLFGGGFALAAGITESGLGAWLSERLLGLGSLPVWALVGGLCLFTTFFTELTSNTASTILLLSLLLGMTQELNIPPLLIMLPVTLSASCAFMLPVATPPNTIVFGSERLSVANMVRAGLVLNVLGAVLLTLATLFWAGPVFGF